MAGPFPDERPLFSIDAKNMEQYKDKLMEGQMELMRRYPSFRLDIYPTHRGVWMPERFVEGTLKNARNPECKTSPDGVGMYGCWGGTPFPDSEKWPRSDVEPRAAQFHDLDYVTTGYLVNANGAITLLVQTRTYNEFPYNNPGRHTL